MKLFHFYICLTTQSYYCLLTNFSSIYLKVFHLDYFYVILVKKENSSEAEIVNFDQIRKNIDVFFSIEPVNVCVSVHLPDFLWVPFNYGAKKMGNFKLKVIFLYWSWFDKVAFHASLAHLLLSRMERESKENFAVIVLVMFCLCWLKTKKCFVDLRSHVKGENKNLWCW